MALSVRRLLVTFLLTTLGVFIVLLLLSWLVGDPRVPRLYWP
jgi:hypothetical protein